MYCYKCGAKLEDDSVFCSECGTKLVGNDLNMESNPTEKESGLTEDNKDLSGSTNNDYSTQPSGNKNYTKWIVLLIILLAVLVGFFIFYILGGNDAEDAEEKVIEETPVEEVITPDSQLDMSVNQIDASEYPIIRVYMDISDSISDIVPSDLESKCFTIKQKTSDGTYTAQSIMAATQLDEEESLNINIVADVSGSMNGEPLSQAKTAMTSFVDIMQFDAGDKVELTSFSTGVRLEQEFCSDKSILTSNINNFETDDMTSLYDALYTGVVRTASQSGAKCVIAFTDGEDNYSNCSEDDVIECAQRYGIPIFIIGFGSVNKSSMSNIANKTGGAYYGIDEVYSMEDIYKQIYRNEKEMYMLEFKAQGGSIYDSIEILVEYLSKTYGGSCKYEFTPKILNSVSDDQIYSTGPEAVVEGYIQNLDDAMNTRSVSPIAPYMKSGSSIYNTQAEYVKKGIDEQLDSYELVSVDYLSENKCIVTTNETFYVQKPNQPLEFMTEESKYVVEKNGNDWLMTDFAELVEVLNRIKV